jgi:hypothetical protein
MNILKHQQIMDSQQMLRVLNPPFKLLKPRVSWFNDTIKASKRKRRKYERVWRATDLESDKAAFNRARNHTNHMIEQAKRKYYTDFINENSTDQRRLFNAVNRLLGRSIVMSNIHLM